MTASTVTLNPEVVKVGDGVTMGVGSDRYAGTVTHVSPSGKTIRFTNDRARRTDSNGLSEVQTWEYESVEEHTRDPYYPGEPEKFRTNARTARWNAEKGRYKVQGGGWLSAGRHHHMDPHF